jgi:hypothetical protein
MEASGCKIRFIYARGHFAKVENGTPQFTGHAKGSDSQPSRCGRVNKKDILNEGVSRPKEEYPFCLPQ